MEAPSNVVRRERLVLDSRHWTPLQDSVPGHVPEEAQHHKQSLHGVCDCICTIILNGIFTKVQILDGALRLVRC